MQSFGGKMWGPINTTTPVSDNTAVVLWSNLVGQAGNKFTADQTLHPTNFISGGGGNTTSPRLYFDAATSTRMNSGTVGGGVNTNIFELIFVVEFNTFAQGSALINGGGTITTIQSTTGGALKAVNNGSTITGANTIQANQWYIVDFTQNGTTATIYTNGVLYVTGTIGSVAMNNISIFEAVTTSFRGQGARMWGWWGNLSSGDRALATAQCKTDFGIQ